MNVSRLVTQVIFSRTAALIHDAMTAGQSMAIIITPVVTVKNARCAAVNCSPAVVITVFPIYDKLFNRTLAIRQHSNCWKQNYKVMAISNERSHISKGCVDT